MYFFRSKRHIHKYKMPSKYTWKFSLNVFLFLKHFNKNEKEGTQPLKQKKNQKQPKIENELKV